MTRVFAGLSLIAFVLATSPAPAQTDPAPTQIETPAPAHLAVIDGAAWLDRQGRSESAPANMPLIAGDRLRTERGRVEVLFGDGSALYLDQFTTVDFQSDALLRLLAGRVRLVVAGLDPNDPDEQVSYRIDAPSASAQVLTVGDYRVSLVGAPAATDVELAVLRGSADLVTDAGSVRVTAGARSVARAGAPPAQPFAFNSARWDAFDRWSEERREARLGVAASSYLPAPLYSYASTFDQYGAWRPHPDYGHVWYPTVSVAWQPYYEGYWSVVGPFGWTWIGYDPWAWPTHHYGRWGFSAGLWFWIPGVHWGPSWVSWRWGHDYVAWGPAGYHPPAHRPWHGWRAAHAVAFRERHVAVPRNSFAVDRLDAGRRATFASRPDAPPPSGLAVPRSASPISGVGRRSGVAVPRSLGGVQSMPRGGAMAVPRASSPASAAPVDRRAVARAPSSAGGLGAPPRQGPTPDSPGLGALAPRARARSADDRAPAARGLSVPRRAPDAAPAAPVYPVYRERPAERRAPAPRDYGVSTPPAGPTPPPRQYDPPPTSRRASDAPAYGRPDAGRAAPRPPASAPSRGGVERSAPPPRGPGPGGPSPSPRGLSPGTRSGAPRGAPGGAAVRRPPG